MADVSFPKIGSVMATTFSLIRVSNGTFFGNFLRWVTLGWLDWFFDFVIGFYPALMSLALVVIMVKWTRNVYVLSVLWLMFFLLIYFGLKTVGVVT